MKEVSNVDRHRIVHLAMGGLTPKEIGDRMGYTPHTVEAIVTVTPRGSNALRDAEIRDAFESGARSMAELAREHQLTKQRIHQIVKGRSRGNKK